MNMYLYEKFDKLAQMFGCVTAGFTCFTGDSILKYLSEFWSYIDFEGTNFSHASYEELINKRMCNADDWASGDVSVKNNYLYHLHLISYLYYKSKDVSKRKYITLGQMIEYVDTLYKAFDLRRIENKEVNEYDVTPLMFSRDLIIKPFLYTIVNRVVEELKDEVEGSDYELLSSNDFNLWIVVFEVVLEKLKEEGEKNTFRYAHICGLLKFDSILFLDNEDLKLFTVIETMLEASKICEGFTYYECYNYMVDKLGLKAGVNSTDFFPSL